MAGTYSVSFTTNAFQTFVNGTAGPIWEIATNSQSRPKITEVHINLVGMDPIAAEACVLGLGQPAAKGTALRTYAFNGEDGAPSNTLVATTEWITQPTSPTSFFRKLSLNAPITGITSQNRFLRFSRGISIPISSSLVLWSIATPTLTAASINPLYFDCMIQVEM
jgi:hypothetical protein